jgi:hypothetical protein
MKTLATKTKEEEMIDEIFPRPKNVIILPETSPVIMAMLRRSEKFF